MPTENILIKFTSDLSGLKSASDELVKMGKLTEEDKKKFDTLLGTIEGIDDALKEAGVEASKFSKEVAKGADSGKSLRTQLADAKNEAVRLSQAFGPFSKEAREAAKRAAAIKDEISDLNDTLDALNPEAKLNAFVKLGQGVQGAFQVATGALQVFGVENERITKLAQQFQGVLNVTQGINSVLQLKDVYTQLRLVLGITTTAQTALGAATTTSAVATTALNSSLAVTAAAAAPVIAAVAALIAITYVLTESIYEEGDAIRKSNEERQKQLLLMDESAKSYLDFIGINEKYYTLLKAQGATELQIAQIRLKNIDGDLELLKIGRERANDSKIKLEFDQKINDLIFDRQILELEVNKLLKEQAVLADQAKNKFTKLSPLPTPKEAEQATIEVFDVIGKTITKLSTDLPQLPFFTPEELQQRKDDLAESFNDIFGAYTDLSQSILALNNQLYQNDLDNLKTSREDGFLTEKQYNDRVKAIRIKQFEENKKFQIAQAIMGTAQGVINALAVTPPNAVPAAIALATALGTLNLFKILSTETPSFKKGTLNFQGGNVDADGGRLAVLHPREAVIPADRNADYHPTIKAVFNRQIKASEINGFVEARLKGKIPNSIDAKIDHRKLGQMIKGNNAVELTNAKMVGKVIAKELSKTMDIRRQ